MTKEKTAKTKTKSCYAAVGGQALMDGILMNAPGQSAFVVRMPDGSLHIEKKHVKSAKEKSVVFRIPLIRGIVNFVESMAIGYKALSRSIDLTMPLEEEGETLSEKDKKKGEALSAAAIGLGGILGVLLAVVMMFVLPSFLVKLLRGVVESANYTMPIWLVSLLEGIIKLVIFAVYIALVSLSKEIKKVFMYHGAEHKTIFCYEHKLPLTVENVKMQKRFHPRCGTSFIIIMLAVGVLIGTFIRFDNPLLRAGMKLLLVPVTLGVGYELLRLCGKYDNLLTKILAAPGLLFQRLTTKEPNDDRIIEIGIASLESALELPLTVETGNGQPQEETAQPEAPRENTEEQ